MTDTSSGPPPDQPMPASRRVRFSLDREMPPGKFVPVDNILSICDSLYDNLLSIWVKILAEGIESYFQKKDVDVQRSDSEGCLGFIVGGRLYSLRTGISPIDSRLLLAGFQPVIRTERSEQEQTEVAIDGGRYGSLILRVDKSCVGILDELGPLSREIIVAGERWIEAFALAQLANITEDPIAYIYSLIRRALPEKLAQSVRIYLLDPQRGGGIYMDQEARRNSLIILKESNFGGHDKSPVELLANLVVARFPISETVARDIVPQMITVAKEPLEVPSANRIGLAQRIIYGPNGLILQPLVASDRLWVEAAYPQQYRRPIEQILEEEKEAIRQGLERLRIRSVSDTSALIGAKRRRWRSDAGLAEQAASIAGRFSGSFFAEYGR